MTKAWFSWSTGKDSAFALYELQKSPKLQIAKLMVTLTEEYDRVSMHSTRHRLLELQSQALGIPLQIISIPKNCSNEIYEERLQETMAVAKNEGVKDFVFGDLFLEDIRNYRESKLEPLGAKAHFPLWQRDTKELAHAMIASGLEAYIICVDTRRLSKDFLGRRFDQSFLKDLPDSVDPCGENGEFHTFVAYAPNFAFRIPTERGELRVDGDFAFCDLIPIPKGQ